MKLTNCFAWLAVVFFSLIESIGHAQKKKNTNTTNQPSQNNCTIVFLLLLPLF